MDDFAKTLFVEFVKQGPLVALLLYLHFQNRADIRVERERNQKLTDTFIEKGDERTLSMVKAMVAQEEANSALKTQIDNLRHDFGNVCKAHS